MVRTGSGKWGLVFLAVMLVGLVAVPGVSWGVDTGTIVYQLKDSGGDWEIYTMNPDGSNTKPLTNNSAQDEDPSFSADGERIIWSSNLDGDYEIYDMDNDGSNTTQLTINSGTADREPFYSPDKTRIVFASNMDGDYEIFTKDLNTGNTQQLTFNSVQDRVPTFSPNGNKIAYASNVTGNWEIWTMDVNGANTQNLTSHGNYNFSPHYSYDGNKIVFVSDRSGNNEIWSMNANGNSPARLTSESSSEQYPSYSPNGTNIVFLSYYNSLKGNIYTIPATCSLCSHTSWTLRGNAAADELYPYWGPVKSRPKPPSNLVLSNVTAMTIDLAWQDNSVNEDEFRVYRGNSANTSTFTQVATNITNDTTYTDTGLTPKTRYYYYVSAYNELGKSAGSNTADTTTLDTQPLSPSNLTAVPVNCSDTRVKLTWKDNSGDTWGQETCFVIERDTDAAFTVPLDKVNTVGTNITTYTDTNLTRNTTYYYRIKSYSSTFGTRGWSPDTATVTTCDTAPNRPQNLAITIATDTRVDLKWDSASANIAGFKVQRSSPDTSSWVTIGAASGDTSFSDTTANPFTHYYYRVRAFSSNGANGACTCDTLFYSAWSNTADTTTLDTVPKSPSNLTAVINCSDSTIALIWRDNSKGSWGNELRFLIERSLGNTTAFAPLAFVNANDTDYTDSGLAANATYYYQVKACNTSGTSPASNIASAQSPPAAPTNLTRTVISSTRVDLSWSNTGSNAIRFCIERGTAPSAFTPINCVDTPTTTYQDTSVAANKYYYYRVKAANASCSSGYSNVVGANTNVSVLRVNTYHKARKNTVVNAAVEIDWCRGLNTIQFDVTFDNNVVSTPSLNWGDLLLPGSTVLRNDTIPNGVRVSINLPGPTPGSGGANVNTWTSIVILSFPVIGDDGYTTLLDLSNSTLGDTLARPITVIREEDAPVEIVEVYAGYCICDDNDTSVTSGPPNGLDVTCLERYLVGLDKPCPIANVDINTPGGDGDIDVNDLTVLEYLWAGLKPPGWPAPGRIPLSSQAANLVLERSSDQLILKADKIEDFHALQLDLGYVPPVQIKGVLAGDITEGAIITTNIENWSGHTRLVLRMPDLKGVSGSGTLLVMPYEGTGDVIVNKLVLGNTRARGIEFNLDSVLTTTVKPTRFSLGQNYPNPLNPQTWIPFELPQDAKVVISIYNLSGQVVRRLSPGLMKAGSYMDKKSAISWDGKDSNGREVASGVYLYQIEAGDFKSTRKMILVK